MHTELTKTYFALIDLFVQKFAFGGNFYDKLSFDNVVGYVDKKKRQTLSSSQKIGAGKSWNFDSMLMSMGPIQLKYFHQDGGTSGYTGSDN